QTASATESHRGHRGRTARLWNLGSMSRAMCNLMMAAAAISGAACQEDMSSTDERSVSSVPTHSAIFGGGPFYSGGTRMTDTLRASGFSTIVVWTIHIDQSGNLTLNDKRVVTDGAYVGDPDWPRQLARLREPPTSVSRIELAVGSAGVNDWHTIKSLIAAQGTGPNSVLYRSFQALIDATGADAIDDDDEDLDDVSTTVQLGRMIDSLGAKLTIAPYTNVDYWATVLSQ